MDALRPLHQQGLSLTPVNLPQQKDYPYYAQRLPRPFSTSINFPRYHDHEPERGFISPARIDTPLFFSYPFRDKTPKHKHTHTEALTQYAEVPNTASAAPTAGMKPTGVPITTAPAMTTTPRLTELATENAVTDFILSRT